MIPGLSGMREGPQKEAQEVLPPQMRHGQVFSEWFVCVCAKNYSVRQRKWPLPPSSFMQTLHIDCGREEQSRKKD